MVADLFVHFQKNVTQRRWHILPVLMLGPFLAAGSLLIAEVMSPQVNLVWLFLLICPLSAFLTSAYLEISRPGQSFVFHASVSVALGLILNNLLILFYDRLLTPSVTWYVFSMMLAGCVLGGSLIGATNALARSSSHTDSSTLGAKHLWQHSLLPLISASLTYLLTRGH